MRRKALLSLAVLAVVLAAGCGSGDRGAETTGSAENPLAGYPQGPTREFIVPGGDNVVQEFGTEASPAERRQVSSMIEAWMRARAAGDWDEECRYLHEKKIESAIAAAQQFSQRKVDCAAALKTLSGLPGAASRKNTMSEPVASLRIGEGHGYAQYHGREGRDWIVAVRRQDGSWKISELEPKDRLK